MAYDKQNGAPGSFLRQQAIDAAIEEELNAGNTIYTADGTLPGDRKINMGGYSLSFRSGKIGISNGNPDGLFPACLFHVYDHILGVDLIFIDPENYLAGMGTSDGVAHSGTAFHANSEGNDIFFGFVSTDGIKTVSIIGNPQANIITVTGKIINPDIVAKNFADDAAAAAGGVEIGEDYHTDGIKKVRIL